jgi:hypothetical protein
MLFPYEVGRRGGRWRRILGSESNVSLTMHASYRRGHGEKAIQSEYTGPGSGNFALIDNGLRMHF